MKFKKKIQINEIRTYFTVHTIRILRSTDRTLMINEFNLKETINNLFKVLSLRNF